MDQIFFVAIALLLIFEGVLPFISPNLWRRVMQHMIVKKDNALRTIGLTSMLFGLALLYFVH